MDEKIDAVYHAFNDDESVAEAFRQLSEGLISPVEYARHVLELWEQHKALPMNRAITSAFPLNF